MNIIAKQVMAARAVSTPLIAIETPDPGATNRVLFDALITNAKKRKTNPPAMFQWDIANGLRPLDENSQTVLASLLEPFGGDPGATVDPVNLGAILQKTPAGTFIVASNLHRFWEAERFNPAVVQTIWNLRDPFKRSARTFVMTMSDCNLPAELRHDVVTFTEAMPSQEELSPIVLKLHENANLPKPDDAFVAKSTSALAGLAKQQAEQAAAMAIFAGNEKNLETLDLDTLRQQQQQQIEQTPGLSIYDGDASFDALKGLDSLTGFLRGVIKGKRPPKAFVFVDEIEKMLAGALGGGSDSSGTSQEQLGYMLSHMQDTNARGILLVGPAGTGKSELAKACGREGDCWTVGYDVGATKGSLVGETGAMTRRALRVVESLAQGEAFWIATCNSINALPPELRRRFSYGTWFVDLPNQSARKAMWKLYGERFDVKPNAKVDDDGWTGAEIKTCASMASDMNIKVTEAQHFISPVSRSSAETIESLRRLATGRFRSASDGGFYKPPSSSRRSQQVEPSPEVMVDADRLMDMQES